MTRGRSSRHSRCCLAAGHVSTADGCSMGPRPVHSVRAAASSARIARAVARSATIGRSPSQVTSGWRAATACSAADVSASSHTPTGIEVGGRPRRAGDRWTVTGGRARAAVRASLRQPPAARRHPYRWMRSASPTSARSRLCSWSWSPATAPFRDRDHRVDLTGPMVDLPAQGTPRRAPRCRPRSSATRSRSRCLPASTPGGRAPPTSQFRAAPHSARSVVQHHDAREHGHRGPYRGSVPGAAFGPQTTQPRA